MASGSAGSIYVDLLLRDTGFQQGLRRANTYSQRTFGGISNDASKARGALASVLNPISNITAALGTLGVGFAGALSVQRIVQYSDAWRQLQGRLSIVESDMQAVGVAQEALFEIAQRNRSPLENVTNFYQRLNQFVPEAVRNQYDLLGVTESVTAAIAITGENSLSANAALVQFSQAIGTNFEAAGQELRSVQEQAPRLAKALSTALGGGTKSLQQLKEEGILTRDSVLRALSGMGEEGRRLAEELAKIPLTVSQAFTRLDNAFLKFIGQSEAVESGTSSIAAAISSLAENLDAVADAAITLGAVIAVRLVRPTVESFAQLSNAVLRGNAVLLEGATASRMRAQAEMESSRQSIAAIETRIAVLKQENAQYRINLTAIQQQRLEAIKQAELSRGIAASGLAANPQAALQAQNAALKSQIAVKRNLAANTQALAVEQTALTAAQTRLTASTLAYDKAAKAATLSSRALSATSRAASGLVNFLGGPWMAAFTAAAGAVWYLSTQQTASEKIIEQYGETLDDMREKGELFSQQMRDAGGAVLEFTESEGWRRFKELSDSMNDVTESAAILLRQLRMFNEGTGLENVTSDIEELKWAFTNRELLSAWRAVQAEFRETGDVEAYAAAVNRLAMQFPEFADRASIILKTADNWQVATTKAQEYSDTINEMGPFPDKAPFIPSPTDKPEAPANPVVEKAKKQAEELSKLYEKNQRYLQGLTQEQFSYNEQIAEFNKLLDSGRITYEQYYEAVSFYQDELAKKTEDSFLDMEAISKRAAENMQDAFADFLFNPFEDGLKGMLRSFVETMQKMLAQQLSSSLFRQIAGSALGAASSALFSGGFNNAGQAGLPWQGFGSVNPQGGVYSGKFGGFFADGGFLQPGQWGIAGEEGAEMIYGGRTGATVIPNGGNGKSGNTYNIDARGADEGAVRRLEAALFSWAGPGVIEKRVSNAQRRGAL